jgi:hypothetical protein
MNSLQRMLFVAGGCVVLGLAGCGEKPAAVKIRTVDPLPIVISPAAPPPMPSYPILLVDLPRQQMGQSVAPARSRLPIGSDRDLDTPRSSSAYSSPYATGLAPHTPTPLTAPPTAPPLTREPIDTRYVP